MPPVFRTSALVVVHNEEACLADCLEKLSFADELVVVLDKCTDGSGDIARRFTDRILEGSWDLEGPRRNAGIDFCRGEWIIEADADEWFSAELAAEIAAAIDSDAGDIFNIPVHNHIGGRLVLNGWGASFGANGRPALFRKGVKVFGRERVHPSMTVTGRQGPDLKCPIIHHVDKNLSDMLARLDRYTTARALDLIDKHEIGSTANNFRKIFSRFWKCYIARKGYREGAYGLAIAICGALYPLISHLKAKLEGGGADGVTVSPPPAPPASSSS